MTISKLRSCVMMVLASAWLGGTPVHAAPKRFAAKPAAKARPAAPKKKKAPPAPESPAPILDDPAPAEEEQAEPVPTPATTADPAPAASAGPVVNVDVSQPAAKPATATASPEALRARYDELRDAVFRSRARRATLEKALFSTKAAFELKWEANRHFKIEKAELRLDGTRLWDASERPVTEEPVSLAARSVAPGAHVLSVRLEVKSRDSASAGYVSEQSFAISLPEGKETSVRVIVDEDGSLPSYNPEMEIELETK